MADEIVTLREAVHRGVDRIRASERLTGPGLRHRWDGIAIGSDGSRWRVTVVHEPPPS